MRAPSPLVNIPVRFGLIAGVLGAILVIVLYYLGKHPFLFPIYFDFRVILFAILMYFTLKEYRDFHKEGLLHLWEGLIMCFIFVTVFALMSSAIIFVFATLEPKFVQSFITLFTNQVKQFPPHIIEQIGKDNFERNLKELAATTSFGMARSYFSQSYIISLFISIILSVVLRKQPK